MLLIQLIIMILMVMEILDGLNTTWTAGDPTTAASFTVRLQHQPDVKTATSGANDGDTDFELQFRLTIE